MTLPRCSPWCGEFCEPAVTWITGLVSAWRLRFPAAEEPLELLKVLLVSCLCASCPTVRLLLLASCCGAALLILTSRRGAILGALSTRAALSSRQTPPESSLRS